MWPVIWGHQRRYWQMAAAMTTWSSLPVASLGWVTPGVATDGVTPLFSPEKPGDLFCSSLSLSISLFIAFTRVSPPAGCHPHIFYLSDLVYPLYFVNLPTQFFFIRVSPPGECHRGGPLPPPPSDATAAWPTPLSDPLSVRSDQWCVFCNIPWRGKYLHHFAIQYNICLLWDDWTQLNT